MNEYEADDDLSQPFTNPREHDGEECSRCERTLDRDGEWQLPSERREVEG